MARCWRTCWHRPGCGKGANLEPLTIRPLKERDFWSVLKILRGAAKETQIELRSAVATVRDAEGNANVIVNQEALIRAVLDAMVGQEDVIKGWLADLVSLKGAKGKTAVEAFDELPLGSTVDILEQLVEQEGFSDFFSRVSRLASKATAPRST